MKRKLGYTDKQQVEIREVRTAKELLMALQDFTEGRELDSNSVYVEGPSGDCYATVRLIESTLTDGSKVYDIRISD